MAIIHCGTQLARPNITPTLSTIVALSWDYPIWACIESGNVMELRHLLSTGSFGLADVNPVGCPPLAVVGIYTPIIPIL